MTWREHVQCELALSRLRRNDPELATIAEFMAETGIPIDELVSLREPFTRKIYGGMLDVFGLDGPRSVPMTDKAWALLIAMAIPDWSHVGSLRSRWLDALAPSGLRIQLEDAMRDLALTRAAERARPNDDEEVPF